MCVFLTSDDRCWALDDMNLRCAHWCRSGIITGPYFKAYFHRPSRFELATMVCRFNALEHAQLTHPFAQVAILEIGAFSEPTTLLSCSGHDAY